LIKILTGINPMKFKKEAEKSMTIKLGYTNCKLYKCSNCPAPNCYQTKEICAQCDSQTELKLFVSFIDSPGHSNLQATALSGASTVDFSLLLAAANCQEDPETNEHYKANKILNLTDKTFIIHNKIDLVTKDQAYDHYDKLKQTYDIKYVIPLCAQFGFGISYLIQFLIEKIPYPINDTLTAKINKPLKANIIRSFDINKVGTPIDSIVGAIVGGTIKSGFIKIGDIIKIIPGIISSNNIAKPLIAQVTSLKTDNTPLQIAYPGGLIGIGLTLDATLSKEDRLSGNYIINEYDTSYTIFKQATMTYNNYNDDTEEITLKRNDSVVLLLGSTKRNIKIIEIDTKTKTITFESNADLATDYSDQVVITKNNKILLYGNITSVIPNPS
ncbi:MAG: eukaryotic translation initiation factor 2, partial [Gaeavirus sp.]